MVTQVGQATGTCSRCGREISRPRPADLAVCDCWEYCPFDHGDGCFATKMDPYTPDLSPGSYEKGDMDVVRVCNHSDHKTPYKSKQGPIEVRLS